MISAEQSREGRGVQPSLGPKSEEHKLRRRFIGPMPENVLSSEVIANRQTQKKHKWAASGSRVSVASQEDEGLRDVIKAYAYQFFKGHGGKDEDWEDEEMGVREEMLQRWRKSEWGKVQSAKESGTKNRWVGTSFDIGTFLGVNILDKAPITTSPTSTPPASPTKSTHTTSTKTGKQPSTTAGTSITAPFHPPPRTPTRKNDLISGTLSDSQDQLSYFAHAGPSDEQPGTGVDESLQGSSRIMDRLQAPDLASVSQSNGTADHIVTPSQRKGKKKQVRYEDITYEDEPTAPSDVLARTGPEVAETSAGAVEAASVDVTAGEGGVLMRGQHPYEPITRVLSVTLSQIACLSVCRTRTLKELVRHSMRIRIGSPNT